VSVAHRLSTAEHADLVLVFDAGHLVEEGSHAELVALGGRYAELYRSWLGNTGQVVETEAATDHEADRPATRAEPADPL
jgi:ABC-type dipeptide/oligopeptide/nickel transport system ATPase component